MMKRKVFVSILLLALVFSAFGVQAFAADPPQNPPYRVRLFAGNSDVGVLTESQDRDDLGYGDPYTFDASKVNIVDDDDRYYVKGFREAGKDNSNGLYADTYNSVERDMDFVVAYGMKGSAVAYTVNFVDANEAPLAASRTLYANVGDKPIVSYIYIEGYEPQAYALTKTLTDNPGDNVFNFTYTEIEPAAGETVVVEGGGGGAPVIPVGGNAGANPAQPAAPAQPETIIDLDVPLAAPEEATAEPGSEAPEETGKPEAEATVEPTVEPTEAPEKPKDAKLASWIPYVLAIGGVGLLSAFLVALRKRKVSGKELTAKDFDEALKEAKEKTDGHADEK